MFIMSETWAELTMGLWRYWNITVGLLRCGPSDCDQLPCWADVGTIWCWMDPSL